MTNAYDTATETLDDMERERIRRSKLEAFWEAWKRNRKDDRNLTWREVLEAAKAVEATE